MERRSSQYLLTKQSGVRRVYTEDAVGVRRFAASCAMAMCPSCPQPVTFPIDTNRRTTEMIAATFIVVVSGGCRVVLSVRLCVNEKRKNGTIGLWDDG